MKHSTLLEASKSYLKPLHKCYKRDPYDTPYICVAVEVANKALTGKYESDIVEDIHIHIRELLEYLPTLKSWLQRNHPEVLQGANQYPYLTSTEINNKLYQTRLAWIDDMIKYYKSQGL